MKPSAAPLLILVIAAMQASAAAREPVFPAPVEPPEMATLLETTAWVRGLDEAELVALVPIQSGLFYVGCPNCDAGRQERQLTWSTDQPDELRCEHCDHRYPSELYPADKAIVVHNPRGEVHRYPYWEDASGYRYFFDAKRDEHVKTHLATRALRLARLYHATGEIDFARRAALILDRFAQFFPGWCYKYDYPHRQKEIFDGDVPPEEFRPGYRTARWTWWAYVDVPIELVQTYDLIRGSGVLEELSREQGIDVAARIESDLLRNAAEQVLANPEPYTNMSPRAWRSLIMVGRVIGEPRYVHEPVRRLRHLVQTQFMYDGSWYEGSPDYAAQTLLGLDAVLDVLRGYSDPPEYRDPHSGERFDDLVLEAQFPALRQARDALAAMRFPDGRHVTVHDTWSTTRRDPLKESQPFLLPALGHACLGGGRDEQQLQLHLTWSGGYGHQHADMLSLILFAHGREILSDIGYTHTRHHVWTLATAAHNTVVIDGASQWLGSVHRPSDGSLRFFDSRDPRVQVVSADGERAYPGKATLYRRTLVLIDAGDGRRYAVDLFEVEGGDRHDYFLHGDADEPGSVSADLPFEPLISLLPDGYDWTPPRDEMERDRVHVPYDAYGFLRDLRAAPVEADQALAVTLAAAGGPRVRVTMFPQSNSRLILGENPSVRNAKENDAKLDEFQRPFMLLRREANGQPSHFVAVIEPHDAEPFIQSIARVDAPGATLALRVELANRSDLVVIGAEAPVTIDNRTYAGDVSVMSLRDGEVEHFYTLGERRNAELLAVEDDALVIRVPDDQLPAKGDVVRLITADGWVYPYNVAEVELQADRVRIRLAEGSGMIYDDAATRLKLTAFPQREHVGPVRIDGAAAHRISSSPDVILPRPHESPESTGPIGHPLS